MKLTTGDIMLMYHRWVGTTYGNIPLGDTDELLKLVRLIPRLVHRIEEIDVGRSLSVVVRTTTAEQNSSNTTITEEREIARRKRWSYRGH